MHSPPHPAAVKHSGDKAEEELDQSSISQAHFWGLFAQLRIHVTGADAVHGVHAFDSVLLLICYFAYRLLLHEYG
ncbi:hypothetical protein V500_09261 [Pseudogymnoascus sp. VKM F-4518 (FW-2643)]|nr:hypothetical protein V500_09261 [Pseudogymnoascus sp. VKM F-4518 (FW-2643)]